MATRDTVLQIVPHLPGTFDGVGDYALNLARALSVEHGIATTFLVAGKTSASSKDGYKVVSGLDKVGAAELARTHEHVILHYANYGYQPRGVPFALRRFVKRLRPQLRGRWVTMFHELYASGGPTGSAFWLRPFQIRIAHDLIDASSCCVVSNAPIEQAIHAYDFRKAVRTIPVMSNFGEPELIDFAAASPKRWVICGGTALVSRSLRQFEQLLPLVPTNFAPEHLDVVGGRPDPLIVAVIDRLKRGRSVHHYPEVNVDLASEVLRQSSFGWLDYFGDGKVWPGMVLKSGALAALCAHGVIPIVSHREESIAVDGDAVPGPFYLKPNAIRFPPPEEVPALRRRCFKWYHAHADSRQTARIYAEALR
ncbi:MAG: hypothetical protein ABR611_03645 [Chthoniobacterales bacterium]